MKIVKLIILALSFSTAAFAQTNNAEVKVPFTLMSPNFNFADNLSSDFEFDGFGCNKTVTSSYSSCNSDNNRFPGFDCNGKNKIPNFMWSNVPKGTKSFAFTIFDPDAQTESGWWHFIIYNISPNIRSIKNGEFPAGSVIVANDGGMRSYMGMCPARKSGKHRYVFTIYALDVDRLDIPTNASGALASYLFNQHKIDTANLLGFYERK